MSTSKLTKKQKKGLAFRERKVKTRKECGNASGEDDAVPAADLPVDEHLSEKASEPEGTPEGVVKIGKKRKRDVKEGGEEGAENIGDDSVGAEDARSKDKKRKLSEHTEGKTGKTAPGTQRFILFVGNLKYSTSLQAIQNHFSACDPPPQIRLLTPKAKSPTSISTKSKGCAFLEFSHRNALQQGLKLHGSTLDGRRINVELTAGGGGKGNKRVEKVKAKNKHLIEERRIRLQKKTLSDEVDDALVTPPQRHSTTSGIEEAPQKRRTWSVPQNGEDNGRGGTKKRGKKDKARARNWGTGANSIAVG